MKHSQQTKLLVSLIALFLSSCLNQSTTNFPNIGIEQSKLNQELEIILFGSSFYKIDKPIEFVVRLRSDKDIYTNVNFGSRMFVLNTESNKWEEVFDPAKPYSEDLTIEQDDSLEGFPNSITNLILSTNDADKLKQLAIKLHPVLKTEDKTLQLMIIVSGYIYENGEITEEKTGAYTIVHLKQ